MTKKFKVLSVMLLTLLFSSTAVNAEKISNIAVVDVNRVVAQSAQVKVLKQEQTEKIKQLQNWLQIAKADVEKQSTKEGKEKLLKKYDAEFAKKQEAIKSDYAKKLQAIDKNISSIIEKTAKAKGYDIVVSKGVILFGGDDITAEIEKAVK